MGKRELVALLNLSSWCLVVVEGLFLAVPWGCLQFVIVVFPDHTHLLFLNVFSSFNVSSNRYVYIRDRDFISFTPDLKTQQFTARANLFLKYFLA